MKFQVGAMLISLPGVASEAELEKFYGEVPTARIVRTKQM